MHHVSSDAGEKKPTQVNLKQKRKGESLVHLSEDSKAGSGTAGSRGSNGHQDSLSPCVSLGLEQSPTT